IPITHEALSRSLGVRRAGITVALHVLEGSGAIRSLRQCIRIRNRLGLVAEARGTYGRAEAEYQRSLGTPLSKALDCVPAARFDGAPDRRLLASPRAVEPPKRAASNG